MSPEAGKPCGDFPFYLPSSEAIAVLTKVKVVSDMWILNPTAALVYRVEAEKPCSIEKPPMHWH